jgi:hypothetical protein
MTAIKVGDEVVVTSRRRRDVARYPGEIVKVGRALVQIRSNGRVETFRIDTGVINDKYGGSWFETPEDATRRERKAAAQSVLREHHITLDFSRHRFTLEQVEALAEVARSFTTPDAEDRAETGDGLESRYEPESTKWGGEDEGA